MNLTSREQQQQNNEMKMGGKMIIYLVIQQL